MNTNIRAVVSEAANKQSFKNTFDSRETEESSKSAKELSNIGQSLANEKLHKEWLSHPTTIILINFLMQRQQEETLKVTSLLDDRKLLSAARELRTINATLNLIKTGLYNATAS